LPSSESDVFGVRERRSRVGNFISFATANTAATLPHSLKGNCSALLEAEQLPCTDHKPQSEYGNDDFPDEADCEGS
jgi:hypothetical protein